MLKHYQEFIDRNYDVLSADGARLSDLPDSAKDEAVYIWLMSHKSWFDDIYPVCFGRSVGKIATEMLFGAKPSSNKLIANLFIAMAEDAPDDYGRDEQWRSDSLDIYIDTIVNLGNFADDLRDRIYLYLEPSIEDEIFEDLEKMDEQTAMDHGIYGQQVLGNC